MASLIRWTPTRNRIGLRRAVDRLFDDAFLIPGSAWLREGAGNALALDVYETDDSVVVKATAPGIKAEDLDISISDNVLTIRGEMSGQEESNEHNYWLRERYFGSVCRSLTLPAQVDADKAEAVFENGVLTLTVAKAEEAKPKTIAVKAKKNGKK